MEERRRRRALGRYRLFAPFYDASDRFNRRLREEAVSHLALAPGQSVLDVGCGTGLSFELIQPAVGPEGRIIGVELSPDMLARAREKVSANGWQNVTLIEAAAEEADIPGEVDAVLSFFTHDIMQSEAALNNVLSHLKPGGRVVAVGGKRPTRWWQLPANLLALTYAPFVTTTKGAARPWARLAELLPELEVEERALGAAYIAYGSKAPPTHS
jgi:ubiquinone/menaquinone biosynthesis C-methylase UbiE